MHRIVLSIATTTLLLCHFVMALPAPPPSPPHSPPPFGYHGVPVGYGNGAHLVDQINRDRLSNLLSPAYQIGHFHDGTRPNNCKGMVCTHGDSYNPPQHNGPAPPLPPHSPPSNRDPYHGQGFGDPHFVGYHGIPVGYGSNAHAVDQQNQARLAAGLAPAYQRGHFHDGSRPNNCVAPWCTHGGH